MDGASVDVSGVWDVEFAGTVQGAGTTQTDRFVMDVTQSGSDVVGSLRTEGSDFVLGLSGTVAGVSFDYEARANLSPSCDAVVEAHVTVTSAGTELSGPQTQSTCEGTAVGTVRGRKR